MPETCRIRASRVSFDNDGVTKVDEVAEDETIRSNPDYLEPRYFQPTRTIRLGLGVSF